MPRLLWQSYGGGRFLISEVPLYSGSAAERGGSDFKGFNNFHLKNGSNQVQPRLYPKGSMAFLQNNFRCPPIGCSKNLKDLKDCGYLGSKA